MIRTQIQLSENQIKQLKKIASKRHESMAEVIREAIDQLVSSTTGSDPEERKKRALAAVWRFHSGISDISEKHDKYLKKAYQCQ